MKSFNKVILMAVVVMMSLLMMSCGDNVEDTLESPIAPQNPGPTSFYNNPNPYGQPNFYGYGGFDCQGINPVQIQENYPDVGAFLSGNPDAAVRYGNRCFYGRELYDMYSQYYNGLGYNQTPWSMYFSSPYAGFQVYGYPSNGYGQSSGSYSYNNTTSVQSQWQGMDPYMFDGGYNSRRPRDQWYFDFNLWW